MSESARFDRDFDFVLDVLDGFLNQGRVQRALTGILESGVSGWEKWLQIELALYLSEHQDVAEWNMEVPFFTDRRRRTSQRDVVLVDLSLRRKKQSTESMLFVELKQDQDWKRCIDRMMRDTQKLYDVHTRSQGGVEIRNFFVAGIHPRERKAIVYSYAEERAEDLNIVVGLIHSRFIPNTPFSLTFF